MDPEEPLNDNSEYLLLPISDLTDIAQEQQVHPALRSIIDDITRAHSAYETIMFALHNGVLYRNNFSPKGSPCLLVIITHLRLDILQNLDNAPCSGHLGVPRTYTRLKYRFH